jgi:hypothetical protein
VPKAFYIWTRDIHLHLGLFVSPFLVVFAVSVFFVNHVHPSPTVSAATTAKVQDLRVPAGIEEAEDMERVQLARQILSQIGVTGEINFIRSLPAHIAIWSRYGPLPASLPRQVMSTICQFRRNSF